MESENVVVVHRVPWNKGKLTGQKPPLKPCRYTEVSASPSSRNKRMVSAAI